MGVGSMLLMERIKRAVDPSNIMNPGKMLDIVDDEKEEEEKKKKEE